MKRICLFILSLILFNTTLTFSQDIRATAKDGQPVILRKNGIWFYFNPSISTELIKSLPEQGTTAVMPNGQIAILKKDGSWIMTNNYQRSAVQNANPQIQKPQNSNIVRLAIEGHGHQELWQAHQAMLNKQAPNLELYDWINGNIPQETWSGKIIVLDFWATWCGPCRSAIPHNNELFQNYKNQNVIIVGACASGGRGGQDRMGEAVEKLGIEYPTAKISDAYIDQWNVHYFPTYAIIDRTGNLRAMDVSSNYVEPIIRALLEE